MSLVDFITGFIRDYVHDPSRNNLGESPDREPPRRAWEDVVVGLSSGADPLFVEMKSHIGPFHWTPLEAFLAARSDVSDTPTVEAVDLTVVSWALAQSALAKTTNRRRRRFPSEPWARARMFGQANNEMLQRSLIQALGERGHAAVAPALLPEFHQLRSEERGRASQWSERHVAYISGLGTFGLSGGLITPLGQAVRLSSIVVEASLPTTPREYDDPFAYCLHYATGGCAVCAKRCPVGSVSPSGRDKEVCALHLEPSTAVFVREEYGFDGYSCGMCQTAVPCESGIPPVLRPGR